MVNFPGRNGRRRRVLNEEVLSASGSRTAFRADSADTQPAYQPMRYSDAAGVENHPQITDFVPRRYRSIALVVVTGIASTLALAGLHYAAPSLAATIGVAGLPPFDLASTGSLATWIAAVVLLVASALCLLVYSLRRHRIDDYRGRYRVWLAASAACLVLSANSVTGLHHLLAFTLSHVTGWTALRAGAVWWLAVAGLPFSWIVLRTLRDVLDCRLAAVLWIAAIGCYVAAAACYLGLVTVPAPLADAMLDAVLALVGHWLLLAAVISYARYVVLDVQGIIPIRTRAKRVKQPKSPAPQNQPTKTSVLSAGGYVLKKASEAARVESSSKTWVDGSRPEDKRFDDDDDGDSSDGKLSKADRKRLRKLKAQNRAA